MIQQSYYVYIITNAHHTVLYTGVTNDLRRRMEEHRSGHGGGFTERYNAHKLVHAERFPYIHDATAREKQIKVGSPRQLLARSPLFLPAPARAACMCWPAFARIRPSVLNHIRAGSQLVSNPASRRS